MKFNNRYMKHCKNINVKPITPKYRNSIGFFLEGNNTAFLMIDDYPFNKLPFPSVGDRVNLDSYGNFQFDYYIVKEILYNLCNPEEDDFTYIEVTVEGCFFPENDLEGYNDF